MLDRAAALSIVRGSLSPVGITHNIGFVAFSVEQ